MVWRASIYAILNSAIVVDIYQLMGLLVGQAVADLSMDEYKCASIPLTSSSWCTLRDKSHCKLLKRRCRVTEHLSPCSWKEHSINFEVNTSVAMKWSWKRCIPGDVLPSTAIFWARGLEKEPVFAQKNCAYDSAAVVVSRSAILSNAVLKAFNWLSHIPDM
jgi:hypothetical protein